MKKIYSTRVLAGLLMFAVSIGYSFATIAPPPPTNDVCANAIAITINGGAIACDNSGTTSDGPNPNCGGTGIKDIWYDFVYNGGTVTIATTLGTNNDTRAAVYASCGGTQIACDDDAGPGAATLITLGCAQLTVGTTYYIQAGGYNALVGTFTLNVTAVGQTGCTDPAAMNYGGVCVGIDDGSCQYNDQCSGAQLLIANAGPVNTSNSITTVNGPNPPCGGDQLIRDVWFYFTYTGGTVTITTALGTNGDTRIAVYDACGGNVLGCNDDISGSNLGSIIEFNCSDFVLGNDYFIQAGGYQQVTGTFSIQLVVDFSACVPGAGCDSALEALDGLNTAPAPNTWYYYTPAISGQYQISTCNLAACDTKIWVYDYCDMNNFNESNQATHAFNDDFCGVQAQVNALLAGGQTYFIRMGDNGGACGSSSFDFEITYNGPVVGCMDNNACNFSPIAGEPGICYYNDDPECDGTGPDLEIQMNGGTGVFPSLYLTTFTSSDACFVAEGCLQGTGTRQILRFTTHIKNIGDLDYFIGVPSANNPQFEWDQCHQHYHYEGYAEYLLYDQAGNPMEQIGFKNGFCVLDLECNGGGSGKYGCGNMGITAGCGDYYSSGLDCQWIDITDVPAGDYYLVVRCNWDQSPDQAGHYEQRYDNNVVQVCIHFDRDANNNVINFTKTITSCPILEDCIGIPFGPNHPDCEGTCPGVVVRGDVEADALLNDLDIHHYLESTLDGAITATLCTDLNNDGMISVADAAYLQTCIHGQEDLGVLPEDITACPWDNEFLNPAEMVTLGIYQVYGNEGYVDISILNLENEVSALEFFISGLSGITQVESLVDPVTLDPHLHFSADGHITMLAHTGTYVPKYYTPSPILRVYFTDVTSAQVCISQIVDAMDLLDHNTLTTIGDCGAVLIDFAQFSATPTQVCEDEYITFADLSARNPISWSWTFEGGTPANTTEQNPQVLYANPGVYAVTLLVNDGIIGDTEMKEFYITIDAKQNWYADTDGDGFGDTNALIQSCSQPLAHIADNSDCDDARNDVYPGAPGTHDGIDNNCNGAVEGDELQVQSCVGDFNGDGTVNTPDLLLFLAGYGCQANCGVIDLTGDDAVNVSDLLIFQSAFGTSCP